MWSKFSALFVLLAVLHFAHAEVAAVCPSEGTYASFGGSAANSASVGLSGDGDFVVHPTGTTNPWEFALLGYDNAAPEFAHEVVIGTNEAPLTCEAVMRTNEGGDLEAVLNIKGTGAKIYSLTEKISPIDVGEGSFEDFYSLSACGMAVESNDRILDCDKLYIRSALDDNRLLVNSYDPNIPALGGSGSFVNPVGGTRTVYFGARRYRTDDGDISGVQRNTAVIMRTTSSQDPNFSGEFDHFNINADGDIGLAANPTDGDEFFVSSYNGQLLLHYDCNVDSSSCDDFVLVPFVQNETYVLPKVELLSDGYGQLHIFYMTYDGSGNEVFPPISEARNVTVHYMFCPDFASLGNSCVDQTVFEFEYSDIMLSPNLTPLFRSGIHESDLDFVLVVPTREFRDTLSRRGSVFRIYAFSYPGVLRQPWISKESEVPVNNDNLFIPDQLRDFDLAVSDAETQPTAMVITYSYTDKSASKKRFTPDNADSSQDIWALRGIFCTEFPCSSYETRQLAGGTQFFSHMFGNSIFSSKVILSLNVNDGNPVYAFSTAYDSLCGPRVISEVNNLVYRAPTTSSKGGPIVLVTCNDPLCNSGSMVRSSDALAGNQGEFLLMAVSNGEDTVSDTNGILLGSSATYATNAGPVFQFFHSHRASPGGNKCNENTSGEVLLVDNELYICSKVKEAIVFDATVLFQWTPLASPLRSQVTADPFPPCASC